MRGWLLRVGRWSDSGRRTGMNKGEVVAEKVYRVWDGHAYVDRDDIPPDKPGAADWTVNGFDYNRFKIDAVSCIGFTVYVYLTERGVRSEDRVEG